MTKGGWRAGWCLLLFAGGSMTGCASLELPRQPTALETGKQRWDEYRAAVKYELAAAELEKGNTDQALSLAREVGALSPNNASHVELLARAYLAKGDFAGARGILEAACRVHASQPSLFYLLGSIYEREGQRPAALDAYTTAAALRIDVLDYQIAAAQAAAHVRGPAAGIERLDAAADRFGGDPAFQLARAELAREAGDLAEAAAGYQQAMRLGADDASTRLAAGMCLYWLGRFEEARPYLAAAARRDDAAPAVVMALARCLAVAEEKAAAAELLEKYTSRRPDAVECWLLLAETRAQLDRPEAALEGAARAAAVAPRNPEAHLLLAGLHLAAGHLDEAAAAACKAVDARPSAAAYLLLGRVYEHREDRPTAAEMYRTALKIEPANATAGELLAALDEVE